MNNKWVLDQTLILETQDISENSSSACIGDGLSNTNYVWDTNNISVCFQLLQNTTQKLLLQTEQFLF